MKNPAVCPFCGKNGAVDTLKYTGGKSVLFRIQCTECKAATGWRDTEAEAWGAWNRREPGETDIETGAVSMVINKDSLVLRGLCYSRNRLTGNCSAQKEFGGKMVRVKEDVFLAAFEECKKIIAEEEAQAEFTYETSKKKVKKIA